MSNPETSSVLERGTSVAGKPLPFDPFQRCFSSSLARLAPVRECDLALLYSWRTDPVVRRHLSSPPPADMAQQRAWHARLQAERREICYLVSKPGPPPIPAGYCQLTHIDWNAGAAESGAVVGTREFRNGGLGFIIIASLLRVAFDHLGFKWIYSSAHPENRASFRFFEEFLRAVPAPADHPYRKPSEALFVSDRQTYLDFANRLRARGPKWGAMLEIEPEALA